MLNNHEKAKVAQNNIRSSKSPGGLGLHSMGLSNIVLMIKHIWASTLKHDSLRLKLTHGFYLKEIDFLAHILMVIQHTLKIKG